MTSGDDSYALPNWCRAFGPCRATADMRVTPADFNVTELMDIEPDGAGEHDWLWIEKTDANTAWLARRLADFTGIPPRDVGYAGMKDRHAVTRQWFSVRRPGGTPADWPALALPGVTVLDSRRHSRKLRRGAHRGNRFEITLRNVDGDVAGRLAHLREHGMPNYFGEQRFGHGGNNVTLAHVLLAGRRLKRDKREIALSAGRALLFNTILDARVRDGSWQRLLPGDIAGLDGTNSVFAVHEVDAELARRCDAFDLHPTGALWGRAADATGRGILAAERALTEHEAAMRSGLERHCAAARRPLRAVPGEFAWEQQGSTLTLRFILRPGSYATALLREVADCRDCATSNSLQGASPERTGTYLQRP